MGQVDTGTVVAQTDPLEKKFSLIVLDTDVDHFALLKDLRLVLNLREQSQLDHLKEFFWNGIKGSVVHRRYSEHLDEKPYVARVIWLLWDSES